MNLWTTRRWGKQHVTLNREASGVVIHAAADQKTKSSHRAKCFMGSQPSWKMGRRLQEEESKSKHAVSEHHA